MASDVLARCGIDDVDVLASRCVRLRQALGRAATRWAPQCLVPAITLAVVHRGWPADRVVPALLAVAADPSTTSPMRLAEAGPWWDSSDDAAFDSGDGDDLTLLEQRLAESDGARVRLQAAARRELAAEGLPVTRRTVVRRAAELLKQEAG